MRLYLSRTPVPSWCRDHQQKRKQGGDGGRGNSVLGAGRYRGDTAPTFQTFDEEAVSAR